MYVLWLNQLLKLILFYLCDCQSRLPVTAAQSTSRDCGWWKKLQSHARRNSKQCVPWILRIDFRLWSESDSPAPVHYWRLAVAPGGASHTERSYRRHHQTRGGNVKVTQANGAVMATWIPKKKMVASIPGQWLAIKIEFKKKGFGSHGLNCFDPDS